MRRRKVLLNKSTFTLHEKHVIKGEKTDSSPIYSGWQESKSHSLVWTPQPTSTAAPPCRTQRCAPMFISSLQTSVTGSDEERRCSRVIKEIGAIVDERQYNKGAKWHMKTAFESPVCSSIARALEHMVGKTYGKCINVFWVSERHVALHSFLWNKSWWLFSIVLHIRRLLNLFLYSSEVSKYDPHSICHQRKRRKLFCCHFTSHRAEGCTVVLY